MKTNITPMATDSDLIAKLKYALRTITKPNVTLTEAEFIVRAVNNHEELVSLAKRVCFPNGGRDYTDAKEELATLVLKLEGKESR